MVVNEELPANKVLLLNINPFCVPKIIPCGVTGGTALTVIGSEVTAVNPVELILKVAEPGVSPLTVTLQDCTLVDKLQLLGET